MPIWQGDSGELDEVTANSRPEMALKERFPRLADRRLVLAQPRQPKGTLRLPHGDWPSVPPWFLPGWHSLESQELPPKSRLPPHHARRLLSSPDVSNPHCSRYVAPACGVDTWGESTAIPDSPCCIVGSSTATDEPGHPAPVTNGYTMSPAPK